MFLVLSEPMTFSSSLRLAATLPLVVGCATIAPPNRLDGTYPLLRVNGEPLPTEGSPLPPRCPPATDECIPTPTDSAGEPCHHFLERGILSLDHRTHRFVHLRIRRSSCGARIVSNFWSTGTYARSDDGLTLGLGRDKRIHGRVDEATIRIEYGHDLETYAGEPLSPVGLSPSGSYRLARVGGEGLPVDVGALVTPGGAPTCSTLISDGELEMEGDREPGGELHFSLAYDFRDSCTGKLLHRVEETGSVERNGRFLGFTADLPGNVIRRFPALLHGSGIEAFRDRSFLFERVR